MKRVLFLPMLCSIMLACEEDVKVPVVETIKLSTIKVEVAGQGDSRVTCDGLTSSFEAGDQIGVFGKYIDNAKFIVAKDLNQADSETACMIEKDEILYAYYPYNAAVTKDHTSTTGIRARALTLEIPTEQVQTDAMGSHITKYDCLVGIPTVAKEASTQIQFNRMNAWLEFNVCNNGSERLNLKGVSIESEEELLLMKGSVDVLANEGDRYMTVYPLTGVDSLKVITQGDWSSIAPGENAIIKASILPYDSSSKGLIVAIETDKGVVSRMRYKGMNFKPGNVYTMTIFTEPAEKEDEIVEQK